MEFPVDLPIGPWTVPAHPVFEGLGYLVGFQAFLWLRRHNPDPLPALARGWTIVAAIFGALAGSKVLAWLVEPSLIVADPGNPVVWIQGKTIVGGLLGGWAAVELAKRAMGVTSSTGDLYAVPLAIGIAIGRIGCFLAGLPDRTYGVPTSLPWGVDFGDGVARHPTQLYEIGFLAFLALAVLHLQARPHRAGDAWKLFIAGYLGWRLAVGFIQPAETLLGLSAIQWACLAGLAVVARHLPRLARSMLAPPTPRSARHAASSQAPLAATKLAPASDLPGTRPPGGDP